MQKISTTCKKIIFFLANLLTIATPFIFTGVNSELFEFSKMLFVYGLTTLMVSCWLIRMIVSKKIIFKRSFLDLPLLLFLLSQIISTFFSIHLRTSIFGYYTRFHGGLLSTISYCFIYWILVNNLNQKQLKALLLTSSLAGLVVSLYAIPEKLFAISPSCIILYRTFDTSCWIQDVQSRVFATFGQPNWLAAYLSMIIPVQLYFFLHPLQNNRLLWLSTLFKQKTVTLIQKTFWLAALLASILALIFTQSRSGFLGLGMGLLTFISVKLLVNKNRVIFKKKALSFAVVLFFFALLIAGTGLIPSLKTIINQSRNIDPLHKQEKVNQTKNSVNVENPGILITPSENIRLVVWQGALNIWKEYPVFGSGPETFAYSYYQGRPLEQNHLSEWDFLYNKAHNELLNFLATSGLVGLLSYLLLMGASFLLMGKLLLKRKNYNHSFDLILAVGSSLIAFNITNFLGFSTVTVTLLWMIVLSFLAQHQQQNSRNIASTNGVEVKKTESDQTNHQLDFLQYVTLACVFLVVAHLLLSIVSVWQADFFFTKAKAHSEANNYETSAEYFKRALLLSPKEALFYDEMAHLYASAALEFQLLDDQSTAKEFATLAIAASDQALDLNSKHIHFHQTRASVFSKLAQIDDKYLEEAKNSFIKMREMSPTYPKPIYHQAIIEWSQGKNQEAIKTMNEAIKMKPNYHQARYRLGQIYESTDDCDSAKKQYQYILDYIIPNDQNLINIIESLDC